MAFHLADRLLFVIRPPAPVAAYIDQERAFFWSGAPVRPEYLHITLGMIDFTVLPAWATPAMRQIGASVSAKGFRVNFDRLSSSERVMVLKPSERIDALHGLRAQLVRGIRRQCGQAGGRGGFSPHITLFHRPGLLFESAIDGVSWKVEEFLLIHSQIGLGRHIELGHWPLPRSPPYTEAGSAQSIGFSP